MRIHFLKVSVSKLRFRFEFSPPSILLGLLLLSQASSLFAGHLLMPPVARIERDFSISGAPDHLAHMRSVCGVALSSILSGNFRVGAATQPLKTKYQLDEWKYEQRLAQMKALKEVWERIELRVWVAHDRLKADSDGKELEPLYGTLVESLKGTTEIGAAFRLVEDYERKVESFLIEKQEQRNHLFRFRHQQIIEKYNQIAEGLQKNGVAVPMTEGLLTPAQMEMMMNSISDHEDLFKFIRLETETLNHQDQEVQRSRLATNHFVLKKYFEIYVKSTGEDISVIFANVTALRVALETLSVLSNFREAIGRDSFRASRSFTQNKDGEIVIANEGTSRVWPEALGEEIVVKALAEPFFQEVIFDLINQNPVSPKLPEFLVGKTLEERDVILKALTDEKKEDKRKRKAYAAYRAEESQYHLAVSRKLAAKKAFILILDHYFPSKIIDSDFLSRRENEFGFYITGLKERLSKLFLKADQKTPFLKELDPETAFYVQLCGRQDLTWEEQIELYLWSHSPDTVSPESRISAVFQQDKLLPWAKEIGGWQAYRTIESVRVADIRKGLQKSKLTSSMIFKISSEVYHYDKSLMTGP